MRKMPQIGLQKQQQRFAAAWGENRVEWVAGEAAITFVQFTFSLFCCCCCCFCLACKWACNKLQLAPFVSTRYFSSFAHISRSRAASRLAADTRLESCHMQHDIMIVIVRLAPSLSLALSLSLYLSINSTRVTGCPILWRVNLTSATKYLHRNCFVSYALFLRTKFLIAHFCHKFLMLVLRYR